MKNYFSFFILIILFMGGAQNTMGWKKGEVVKSEILIASIGNGQSGFTEMDPTQTGITAANQISEKEVLGNQHLMHGSGIALGDVNGDGWVDIYMARIRGTKNSPWAFGAKIQVSYKDGSMGPIREIQSGSGYWSQNSPVQILGIKSEADYLNIQWPDGSKTTEPLKGNKLTVSFSGD